MSHVVWDWNGTLLDDLPIVIEAVNRSISDFGYGPIGAGDYRDHYTRPVKNFYESMFRRPITDEEWLRLNTSFHEHYFHLAETARLTSDGGAAMDMLATEGLTQSLLSMSPNDWLAKIVSRLGLTDRFVRVDGLTVETGGLKAPHLASHLNAMRIDASEVVAIGDTPDDAAAARHVGARVVLYNGGSHHRNLLEAEDVPVADSLLDAVDIAVSLIEPADRSG